LNYLRIPILANIFFNKLGDDFRPKISLGPSFGFLLGVKNSMTVITTEGTTVTTIDAENTDKDEYAGFDLSAIIGAGFNYKIGARTWLNMDARYSIGATNVFEVETDNKDEIRNNAFSVTAGIAFGFGEVE
jgi:hypothetical protein